MKDRIQAYLYELKRALWLRGLADAESLAEIESHLLEAVWARKKPNGRLWSASARSKWWHARSKKKGTIRCKAYF